MLMMQVLYTDVFVASVSLGFNRSLAVRQANIEAAFPILLSSSMSRERFSVTVEPRYVN